MHLSRMVHVLAAGALWLVVTAPSTAAADEEKPKPVSLVELARRNRAERAGQAETGRVLTNADLAPTQGHVSRSTPGEPGPGERPADPGGDDVEREFFNRVLAQVRLIADLERRRDVAVLEVNRLRRQYANSPSGPFQNRVLKPALDEAFRDQEQLARDVEQARRDLEALRTEARRAGVAPRVIREAEAAGQKMPEAPLPDTD